MEKTIKELKLGDYEIIQPQTIRKSQKNIMIHYQAHHFKMSNKNILEVKKVNMLI